MRSETKVIMDVMDTQATAGETNTFSFQHQGYDYAIINLGLVGTETTDPPTVITLTDSTDNTTFGNITNLIAGTDWTVPTAVRTLGNHSQGPTIVSIRADLRNVKRYVKLTCNAATKMTQVVNISLSNGKISPSTATLAGVDTLVVG